MWTLKSLTAQRKTPADLQPNEPIGHLLLIWVEAVFKNGRAELTVTFPAENRDVIQRTVATHLARMNEQEEVMAEIAAGSFSAEPPAPPEPAPEQVVANELAQAQSELETELARANREKEAIELAKTDPLVAEKLEKLNLLRAK
ncbi:MAG: hypothetical protein C0429_09680 [Sphingopyxis sp.]|nr:hypothetical protein [Sphingopyxis sp.]